MPVPTSITDLTNVAATNSPGGTESVKGTIDDYLRAHAAFIRQIYDQSLGPTVTLASAATVAVGFAGSANILITGTGTITAFDAIAEGTLRWIVFGGAMTLTHNGASFYLPGGASIATAAGDAALFKSLGGGNWKCLLYERVGLRFPASGTVLSDASIIPTNKGGTGEITPAASLAALGGLPLSGGALSGNLTFVNNAGIYAKDAGGTTYQQLTTASDNNTYFTNVGAQNIYFQSRAGAILATLTNAGAFSAVVVTETSDERKKRAWQHLPKNFISQLAGIKKSGLFTWRKDGMHGIGVGAQSLERILPAAVHTADDGTKSVGYGPAAMVASIELARAFIALEKRIAALEAK